MDHNIENNTSSYEKNEIGDQNARRHSDETLYEPDKTATALHNPLPPTTNTASGEHSNHGPGTKSSTQDHGGAMNGSNTSSNINSGPSSIPSHGLSSPGSATWRPLPTSRPNKNRTSPESATGSSPMQEQEKLTPMQKKERKDASSSNAIDSDRVQLAKVSYVSQGTQTTEVFTVATKVNDAQTIVYVSRGTQTEEFIATPKETQTQRPKYVSRGTQTMEVMQSPTNKRGSSSGDRAQVKRIKPTMVSRGTQTDEIPSVEMSSAAKGEKEADWEDTDPNKKAAVEDADWVLVGL